MAGISSAQILQYLQETISSKLDATATDLAKLSTEIAGHLAADEEKQKTMDRVIKVLEGNGEKGVKSKVDALWDEHEDGKKLSIGLKEGILLVIISAAVGNIDTIFQWLSNLAK
jgi:hypothetical protein